MVILCLSESSIGNLDASLVNTNLQPDAVVLQVVSLLFLEWAALPPRENGP